MSNSALEIFPTWMRSYLSGIVHSDKIDTGTAVWIQDFTRWAFDLLKNAMAVGVLQYLALKGKSRILNMVSEAADLLLIVYCISYVNSWHLSFFHPIANRRVGLLLDTAVGIVISIALLVGISVTVEASVHEIARLQGK
jgi:hypothetical protein